MNVSFTNFSRQFYAGFPKILIGSISDTKRVPANGGHPVAYNNI